MVDFLLTLDWSAIIIALLVAFGGGFVAWYRKKFKSWAAFWREILQGLHALPELQKDVKGIRLYVSPNGGGSLMDAARRTELAIAGLVENIDLVVHTMAAENDTDDEIGRFHCGFTGENTYVNQVYARWLAVGKTELLGWSFQNFIHADDIDRIREHWDRCRLEHRQYRMTHRFVASNGTIFTADVIATPIPDVSPIKRWVGIIRKIPDAKQQQ